MELGHSTTTIWSLFGFSYSQHLSGGSFHDWEFESELYSSNWRPAGRKGDLEPVVVWSPERDMTWQEDDNPGSAEPRAGTKGGLRRTVTQSVNCYSSLITPVIKRPSQGRDEKTKQTQHSLRLQSNPITERGSPQDWPTLHTRSNLFKEQKIQLNHFYCFIR